MPFDAIFLSAVAQELRQKLLGQRVEKIQQPSRDTVLLTLRGKEKLLLSANVNRPRIHLTLASFENPAQPPMFCMLLRKHLSGGRIAAITQPPAERSVELVLDCTDEMGYPGRSLPKKADFGADGAQLESHFGRFGRQNHRLPAPRGL